MKNFLPLPLLLLSFCVYANNPGVVNTIPEVPKATCSFEENKGQFKDQFWNPRPDVLFGGETNGLVYHLFKDGISYQIYQVESWKEDDFFDEMDLELPDPQMIPDVVNVHKVDVRWVNANANCEIEKGKPLPGYNNYYNTPEEARPALFVKKYESVRFKNIWNDIDVLFYNNNGNLESDFLLQRAEDYRQIRFEVSGAELSLDAEGNLIMKTPIGEIREGALKVFQGEQQIEANWVLEGNTVGFEVFGYAEGLPLRIDPPVILWGTYYGGNGIDIGHSCTSDNDGNIYLAGNSGSQTLIAMNGHQNSHGGGSTDAYLVKFDPNGNRLWSTYYGGSLSDNGLTCFPDTDGNIFLGGNTASLTNISTSGAHQTNYGGGTRDGFLVKFDSTGVRLWGTYYGGAGNDFINSGTIDVFGHVFITGYSNSPSNIATIGAHQSTIGGGNDAFLVMFSASGTRLWGSYIGGSNTDRGRSCKTDIAGNIYITGHTSSQNNIATSGAYQSNLYGGSRDAFLVKFSPTGSRIWGTYFGGEGGETGYSCAVDFQGNVYLTGSASSENNISTPMAHQTSFGGGNADAFLAKFNSNGTRLWSTYFGGDEVDYGFACAVDNIGNVFISGQTQSTNNISTPSAHQTIFGGALFDGFFAKFSTNGIRYWGSFYGGTAIDFSRSCTVDPVGNFILAGQSSSQNAISTPGSFRPNNPSSSITAFLAKFDGACLDSITLHPMDKNTKIDSTVQLVAHSSDSAAFYQWQTDTGSGFEDVKDTLQYNGATTNTLTISNITIFNINQSFRCVINTMNCLDTTNTATLNVDTSSVAVAVFGADKSIIVYPNPASRHLIIQCGENHVGASLKIHDVLGRNVYSGTITSPLMNIDVEKYPRGIYFIDVSGEMGRRTFKVVLE
ncbi:MAG: SBBP repeat-containing protein [Cryomorphaceae bacterium]|nr:SBBP repeat-containing protein [Cryomorphaceae bacterium]